MFWYETLSGFQHAVSSNAHNMNYGLLMTNVPLLHMMQEGFFDFQKKTNIFFQVHIEDATDPIDISPSFFGNVIPCPS